MVRTIVRKGLVVAGVIGVTLLGNLRLQASEIAVQPRGHVAPRVSMHDPSRPTIASADEAVVDATFEPSAATDAADADSDDARLVPAIYAWDPDVRFVFFRHVSKWM